MLNQSASQRNVKVRPDDEGVSAPVCEIRSQGARTAGVTLGTVSQRLLDFNGKRLGCSVFNNTTATLLLLMGENESGVSTSYFTVKVLAGGYWEAPVKYCGMIFGALAAAPGSPAENVLTTEYY